MITLPLLHNSRSEGDKGTATTGSEVTPKHPRDKEGEKVTTQNTK